MSDPTESVQDPQIPAAAPEAAPDAAPDAAAAQTEPAAAAAPRIAELPPAACGAKLAELFPALFATEGPPKPLKLRIQADIQQRAPQTFTRKSLGLFFSRYTTSNAYLKALLNAPHRFDLDGQPAGEISAEHQAAATEELARRRTIAEDRRAAEREARRAAEKAAFKARQKAERQPRREAPRSEPKPPAVEDPARRGRAFLLRAFETSSLTKANFCALKRIGEAELDAQLELARRERAERPPRSARPPHAA